MLDRTVDVHIGRLRDKLGDDAERPRYVATVRGVGYRIAPTVIGRGIATRIALAALVSAGAGLPILAIGVTVVGAEIFRALMVEAGDSADHAQAMYDESVTTVVLAAVLRRRVASVVLAIVLARMLARPLAEVGGAARRIAEGDYAARVPRDGPEELASLADSFNQMAASLERQEAMRRDFIANAAHELRTPLTNLQGYLEALRDGVIAADRATYDSLLDEAERLVRLSHSLDALAEGDAATTPPRLEELDLRDGHPGRPRPRPADPRAGRPHARRRRPGAASGAGQPRRTSRRSWPTSSRTRRATRRPAAPSRSAPSGVRRTSWSRSRTPATASRKPTSSASSNASTASRSRAIEPAAAPASAWPSSSSSSRRAAVASVPSRATARPGSGSACRPDSRRHGRAIATIPTATPARPSHWIRFSRSPRNATATRIVTAGPNDEASPTIQVGALASPIANETSPRTSSSAGDEDRATTHCAGLPRRWAAADRLARAGPRSPGRASATHGDDRDRRGHDPRRSSSTWQPAGDLEGDVGGDRHQREEHERDDREDDARPGEPGARAGRPRRRRRSGCTPTVAIAAPNAWVGGQRLAAEDHRQDDGQPAVRGDHPADHRDRADPQAGEVGEVGPGPDEPEQSGRRQRRRGRPGAPFRSRAQISRSGRR